MVPEPIDYGESYSAGGYTQQVVTGTKN